MSPQCVRHMKVLWYAGRSMAANFREPIFPSGEPAQRFLGDLETNSLGSGLAAVAQCEEWLFWLFSADGDGYVLGKFPGSLFLLLWLLTFLHLLPPPSSSFFFFYYFIFLPFLLYLFPLLSLILSIVFSVSSSYFFLSLCRRTGVSTSRRRTAPASVPTIPDTTPLTSMLVSILSHFIALFFYDHWFCMLLVFDGKFVSIACLKVAKYSTIRSITKQYCFE